MRPSTRPLVVPAAVCACWALAACGAGGTGTGAAPGTVTRSATVPTVTVPEITTTSGPAPATEPGTPTTTPAPSPTAAAPTGPAPPGTAPAAPPAPADTAPREPRAAATEGAAVTMTVRGYATAFVGADGIAGCALMTPATRREFVASVREDVGDVPCDQAFARIAEGTPPDVRQAFGAATVSDVRVTGQTAVATLAVGDRTNTITLSKVDGRWLISSAPGR